MGLTSRQIWICLGLGLLFALRQYPLYDRASARHRPTVNAHLPDMELGDAKES